MTQKVTRGEIEDIIRKFAAESPDYRQALIDHPVEILTRQMGTALPEDMKVEVVQEPADTIYVVAPFKWPGVTPEDRRRRS